jgi:hypothetical protein
MVRLFAAAADWFGDYAGRLARKLVAFKIITRQPISYRLGNTVAACTLKKFNIKPDFSKLKPNIEDIHLITQLEKQPQKPFINSN